MFYSSNKMGVELWFVYGVVILPLRYCLVGSNCYACMFIGLPGVIFVKPDPDFSSLEKDYRSSNGLADDLLRVQTGATLLFPAGNSKHWLVRMDKPGVGVVTKAQVVDFYAQILTKVMGK